MVSINQGRCTIPLTLSVIINFLVALNINLGKVGEMSVLCAEGGRRRARIAITSQRVDHVSVPEKETTMIQICKSMYPPQAHKPPRSTTNP